MIRPEHFVMGGKCGLAEDERFRRVTGREKQAGQIVANQARARMFGAEYLLADRQRALIERTRIGKVALVLELVGEIAEAHGRAGMLRTEHLLADC